MPQNHTQPARYEEPWKERFDDLVVERLGPGMTVLDVGGGRHPALPVELRPDRVTYIGLDPDVRELAAAPEGSYDLVFAHTAESLIPELEGTVDLAISWQVFEHLHSLEAALDNIYRYLRPGGSLVSMFSGRWSAFAVVNRMIPQRIGFPIVDRVAKRTARGKPIFPAHYDRCSASALRQLTANWSHVDILPLFRGAAYFSFARPVLQAYLRYENAISQRQYSDLATHYLLAANR